MRPDLWSAALCAIAACAAQPDSAAADEAGSGVTGVADEGNTTATTSPTGADGAQSGSDGAQSGSSGTTGGPSDGALKAFPTAEGFGADAVGGRGGAVIEVTTLEDDGPGSLRACVAARGPRTCVFRVGGTIVLESNLDFRNPFLTIAGQTAPGGGVTIRSPGAMTVGCNCEIGEGDPAVNDVIIRYVRFRKALWPGTQPIDDNTDALNVAGGSWNIIIDHCTFSWGTDETLSVIGGAHEITVQWSMIVEGYFKGTHVTSGAYNVTMHHNLFAHNQERNPKLRGRPEDLGTNLPIYDFVNNVVYNWTNYATAVAGNGMANVVGNYYKLGPNTTSYPNPREIVRMQDASVPGAERTIYAVDNAGPTCPDGCTDDWDDGMVSDIDGGLGNISRTDTRLVAPEVATVAAIDAYVQVLGDAGATIGLDENGQPFMRRDAVDARIADEVETGTGGTIGPAALPDTAWPTLDPGTPYPDTDHDGMADPWEVARGFDPSDSADNVGDRDGDGYTNLEEFLNATDPG